ncbi:MAG: Hsp20/alpha crystallin family protein [Rubrobacteraceae bacterium]
MNEAWTNPFRGFVDVASEMSRMRELGKTGHETGHEGRRRTHATAWVPSADIFARGGDLVIRLSLSGVSLEDIDITFSNNTLTASGKRQSEDDETQESFYVRELYYGAFRRSITTPSGIDESAISAEFDNGMLEVTVRGGASAEPRRIEVKGRE